MLQDLLSQEEIKVLLFPWNCELEFFAAGAVKIASCWLGSRFFFFFSDPEWRLKSKGREKLF